MRLLTLVTALRTYLNPLFREVAHPSSGWNEPRRRFVVARVLAIVSAGTTVLSDVVRAMPGGTAIRHRYEAVDRMLARVDLVELAAAQTARLADGVGAGWAVPIDMTDIRKLYAKKMEALAGIHDGSTGQLGRGYSVVTACAFHLAGRAKAQPLPLLFEVFSSAEEDFKSQNTSWLDAIDRIQAVAPRATVAMDREGDNGKLLRRHLDHHQPFVTRLNTHEHSRHLLFGATSRARVMDVWKEATLHRPRPSRCVCRRSARAAPVRGDASAETRPATRPARLRCLTDTPAPTPDRTRGRPRSPYVSRDAARPGRTPQSPAIQNPASSPRVPASQSPHSRSPAPGRPDRRERSMG